ncbi:PKD repeat protein [Aquimarina sp. EL_43]|uniref:basic secretory protein-like protein n=2 Tax=Aquimarina TaxID=290174 RepID=UPI0018CA4757|nr:MULTISPECIES: basic secretory protein-like protein [unclassified Aquimarina]MBG6133586.1 PKD repeat protein [Aquimarina sp. EL_35]MBG6153804.1 PKD repeat protein [Aquimarina sp. EL_32]MBG6171962.1 PKD repeat protein [Aquimarina sp. EL_43]
MKNYKKHMLWIGMLSTMVFVFKMSAQPLHQTANNENNTFSSQSKQTCIWGNDFLTPRVEFRDFDGSTVGSQVFNQVIPNAENYMKQRCLDVAKILYRNSADAPKFRLLKFNLKNEDFVAHKFGDGDQMTIEVSTQHLAKIYRDSGNNSQVIKDEIDGILFHEVTHGYNYSPSTGGTYDGSSPFWAYTEGIADGVRIYAGFHQTRTPDVNNSRKWLGGYTTTGFFLQYVTQKYDKNFIYKFNKAAKDLGNSWSFDNAFKDILGKGVETVWDEYKNYINNGNTLDYDGDYPWNLDCGGSNGDLIDITNDGGTVSSQYNDSPSNEGISKLIDNTINSKYLTFNASAWVQYKASTSYILSSYTLSSANDAPERDPKNWTLQGSTNGNSWQNIDQRSNQDFPNRHQKRSFTVNTSTAYKYYRLSMANNSGTILQVAEVELFGKEKNTQQLPIADFKANKTNIKEEESISYTNSSTDATSYNWTFDGGSPSSSTQTNPVVTYNRAGTYSVTLKVINRDGSDTKIKSEYITVSSKNDGGEIIDITNDGGTISDQHNNSPSYEDISKLIDNNPNSKFLTFNASAWVQYIATKNYTLSSYTITSGNDAPERDPKSWTLQGSTNGSSWQNIDQRSNQNFPNRNQKRTFQVSTTSSYNYYRLSMRNNSGTILQASEIELFGKGGSTDGGSCSWGNDFLTPRVEFRDFDGSTVGSQIFNQVIPNAENYMKQRCLDVAKILYRNSADAPKFRLLKFNLKNEDFVAHKFGDGDQMTIEVSTQHLAKIYRDSGNNSQVIKDEIDGILFHEVTHGYNYSPTTGGTYDGSSPFWAYTEGIADGVRIYAGFHQTRNPDVNNSRKWLGGYTTTGFFLQYVTQKYDKNFIYKFNKAAKDLGNSWSFDNAFKDILGKGVETVWNEYKNYINNGNTLDYDGDYPWNLDCGSNNRSNLQTVENKNPESAFNLKSYPNPVKDKLLFVKPQNLKNTSLLFEIYDTQGALIFTEKTSGNELSLDHLESKMYFIIVKQYGKTIYRNRFIKR